MTKQINFPLLTSMCSRMSVLALLLLGALSQVVCAQSTDLQAYTDQIAQNMLGLDGGIFLMGSAREDAFESDMPQHQVTVPDFRINKYELTIGEFRQFVESTGFKTDSELLQSCGYWDISIPDMAYDKGLNWQNPDFSQPADSHPAVCLSWNDSQAYIAWLNELTGKEYRLPTEAEWEYAARAGTDTLFSFGDNPEDVCEYANGYDATAGVEDLFPGFPSSECSDGFVFTAPVGSFKPNPFGLYDIHGNIFEWVQDCWHENYEGAPNDGSAWIEDSEDCNLRSRRSGSWDYETLWQISTIRYREPVTHSYHNRGFRLAESLTP